MLHGPLDIRPDAELGYAAAENVSTEIELTRSGLRFAVHNDAIGARVDEPGQQTAEQVDLVTVGGSFAWGWGVASEETFTQQLGRDLSLGVANLAVRGYSTLQAQLTLARRLSLRPRVVVYLFIPGHAERNLRPCGPSMVPFCKPVPYVAFDGDGALSVHPPRTELFDAARIDAYMREVLTGPEDTITPTDLLWRAREKLLRWETRDVVNARQAPPDDAAYAAGVEFALARMADDAARAGAELVVFYVPPLYRPRFLPPPDWLRGAAARENATFVDFSGVAAAHAESGGELLSFRRDPHPSPAAHALMAKALRGPVRRALAAHPR